MHLLHSSSSFSHARVWFESRKSLPCVFSGSKPASVPECVPPGVGRSVVLTDCQPSVGSKHLKCSVTLYFSTLERRRHLESIGQDTKSKHVARHAVYGLFRNLQFALEFESQTPVSFSRGHAEPPGSVGVRICKAHSEALPWVHTWKPRLFLFVTVTYPRSPAYNFLTQNVNTGTSL